MWDLDELMPMFTYNSWKLEMRKLRNTGILMSVGKQKCKEQKLLLTWSRQKRVAYIFSLHDPAQADHMPQLIRKQWNVFDFIVRDTVQTKDRTQPTPVSARHQNPYKKRHEIQQASVPNLNLAAPNYTCHAHGLTANYNLYPPFQNSYKRCL